MMSMPTHILIGLWNAKKGILEEENKAEQEAQQKQGGISSIPTVSSMMNQAKSNIPRMPSIPSSGSYKVPH